MDLRPPKSLVIQGWAKSAGILLLGVSAAVTSVAASVAVDTIRELQNESQCRSDLINETSSLEGEISATGWSSALKLRGNNSPDEIEAAVQRMTRLVREWEAAQDKRDRASEICEE